MIVGGGSRTPESGWQDGGRAGAPVGPSDSRPVTPGVDVESDRRLMPAIRGLRLTIIGVNAKFKYGGNKTVEHRADIAAALQIRNAPMDAAARRRLMSRPAAPMGM